MFLTDLDEFDSSLYDLDGVLLLPLTAAVEKLEQIVPDIGYYASRALERNTHPSNGLTSNESAVIDLYTMEWEGSVQMELNHVLRTGDHELIKPFYCYFKLLLTALEKLPSETRIVWRAARADLTDRYPIGQTVVWQGFR